MGKQKKAGGRMSWLTFDEMHISFTIRAMGCESSLTFSRLKVPAPGTVGARRGRVRKASRD